MTIPRWKGGPRAVQPNQCKICSQGSPELWDMMEELQRLGSTVYQIAKLSGFSYSSTWRHIKNKHKAPKPYVFCVQKPKIG